MSSDDNLVQLKSELTCLSASVPQRLVAVGGRSNLTLLRVSVSDSVDSTPTLRVEHELSDKSTSDVAMNPSMETVLASGTSRRSIELWDLVSLTSRSVVTLDRAAVTKINWQASDPNTLLVGATDGSLRILDVRSQDPIHTTLAPRSREVRDCQFDPHDSCYLAACFDNGTVQTFDSRQPKQCARKMVVHDGPALCLAYHPTRRGTLASGGSTSNFSASYQAAYKLKIVAPDRETFVTKSIRCPGVSCVAWRGGGNSNEVAAGLDSNLDHDVLVWNTDDGYMPPHSRFRGHEAPVSRIAFLNHLHQASSGSPSRESSRHGQSDKDEDESDASGGSGLKSRREVSYLISAGRDGKVLLQRQKRMFLFERGRRLAFGPNSLAISNDNVRPEWAMRGRSPSQAVTSPTRGNARVLVIPTDLLPTRSTFPKYRISGFASLDSACEYNEAASRVAGSSKANGFWKTFRMLFKENASTSRAVLVSSISDSPVIAGTNPPAPSLHNSTSGVSKAETAKPTRKETSSLLRELASMDQALALTFRANSKLSSFRQLALNLAGDLGQTKREGHGEGDGLIDGEPSTILSPTKAGDNDVVLGMDERLRCVAEALKSLVDREGDVHTAVVCVVLLAAHGFPVPIQSSHIKRWGWALESLLEMHARFPEAIEVAQEVDLAVARDGNVVESVVQREEKDVDSRIGMACGKCSEPLPKLADDGCCPSCGSPVAKCSVCRMIVKAMYVTCLFCGHGGHVDHLGEWFAREQQCPLGCGCNCVLQS